MSLTAGGKGGKPPEPVLPPLPAKRRDSWPDWETKAQSLSPRLVERGLPAEFEIPRLPELRKKRSRGVLISFLIVVVVPLLLIAGYYYLIAADQYVAEFRFSVTQVSPPILSPAAGSTGVPTPTVPNGASNFVSTGPAAQLLGGNSVSNGSDQNFVVVDYLMSRQVIDDLLGKGVDVRQLYSRRSADWWARFSPTGTVESFVDYWNTMLTTNYDMVTGLATVQVKAFTPDDAQLIANNLVALSEDLVNRIAMRSKDDAVQFAQKEVDRTQKRLAEIRTDLTQYRNSEGVIDPTSSVVPSNASLASTLRATLSQLQTNLNTDLNQGMDAKGPAIVSLRSQIDATKHEIAKVEQEVAKNRNGGHVLSDVVGRYEQLQLKWQYAQTMLLTAEQNLDQARGNAAAQSLYLTPYVTPAKPESATYPKRFQSTLLVGLALCGIWFVGFLLTRAIKQHVT